MGADAGAARRSEREGGGAGRRRVRGRLREQRGGAWGARRALTCGWVRVPASRQAKDDYRSYKRSALHLASAKGLAGTVAQLLALGADATLTDKEGKTAVEHAGNDKVKAAFVEHAEHSDITDDNKDALLLLCACLGLASRVRAVLQAGAKAAFSDQVRVRAPISKKLETAFRD